MRNPEKKAAEGPRLGREFFGLFYIFCGLLLLLSLATFDSRDPWLNHVVSEAAAVHNRAGRFGAYVSGTLFDLFGIGAWSLILLFGIVGARRVLSSEGWPWWRWSGFFLFLICLSLVGAARDVNVIHTLEELAAGGDISSHGGGLLGHALYKGLMFWLGAVGTVLFGIFAFLLAVQLLVGFSWVSFVVRFTHGLWNAGVDMAGNIAEDRQRKKELKALEEAVIHDVTPTSPATSDDDEDELIIAPTVKGRGFQGDDPGYLRIEGEAPGSALAGTSPHDDPDIPPWVTDFENEDLEGAPNASESGAAGAAAASTTPADLSVNIGGSLLDGSVITSSSARTGDDNSPVHATENEDDGPAIPIYETPEIKLAEMEAPKKELLNYFRKTPKQAPLPGIDLLDAVPPTKGALPRSALEAKGRALMNCLTDFGIQCELTGIIPGPVVTMFEIRPAPGVRVSRIAGLSDDLALALKAVAVRIQAPVPGTDTVGIEIPNEVRETVCFKELIRSEVFQDAQSLLTIALGKDIAGHPVVANLATMPHLLMAGATGAGKSVGINSLILSLLYKARPEEVKLLLVDPKRVEMAIYADLPHLVHPVVTEMSMAKNALAWAVAEMERRYSDIAKASVRNIADYNAKLRELGDKRPDGMEDLEFMPYLVIIIDELADLMMVGAKEVEQSVVRLAQLARAAGIHLVLATQRPSVDVVTGLIKANFPSRISFQVTSKHDSRTILDAVGAEHLLGKGDMLYKPSGGRFQRLHGAFVSDKNVINVTDYWRSVQKPSYAIDFSEWGGDEGADGMSGASSNGDLSGDPLYLEAVEFVRQQGRASISLIQRRFRIGFNKAARIVEQMEYDGLIGPADGSKPRLVIR